MAMALAAARKARRASHSLRRHAPAAGLGAVILVPPGPSFSHLAHGVQIVIGCEI
jgi:hypothetical protein